MVERSVVCLTFVVVNADPRPIVRTISAPVTSLALVGVLLVASSSAVATPIPDSETRNDTAGLQTVGNMVVWTEPNEKFPCPTGSQPGHPDRVTPSTYRGSRVFDLSRAAEPAWSGQVSGFVINASVSESTHVLAERATCDMPYAQSDLGWLNTSTGEFTVRERLDSDAEHRWFDFVTTKVAGDEAIDVSVYGPVTRLDRVTGRVLHAMAPTGLEPIGRVGQAANGDLVWVGRGAYRYGTVVRWSLASNTISTAPAIRRYRPGKSRWSGREVYSGLRWLDPDTGLLHDKLSALDSWGAHGGSVAGTGRWIAVTTSNLGGECCELVLDSRTGEYRKVPPGPTADNEIVALTREFVVWETQDARGRGVGPLQFRRITSLPKAVELMRVMRTGTRITMRWRSYGTPGSVDVRRYVRGQWEPVSGQRAPRPGVLSFTDLPGRQLYRIHKGSGAGFASRRVLL